jgi:hypothetical protein
MKTLTMFLVVSTLAVMGCSGSPETNGDDRTQTEGATPQSSPAQEDDSIPRERASVVVPFDGNASGRSGQPSVPDGTTGGSTPSTRRHTID